MSFWRRGGQGRSRELHPELSQEGRGVEEAQGRHLRPEQSRAVNDPKVILMLWPEGQSKNGFTFSCCFLKKRSVFFNQRQRALCHNSWKDTRWGTEGAHCVIVLWLPNKLPQAGLALNTESHSLAVLEAGSLKSGCQQSHGPSEDCQGNALSPLPASDGSWRSLARGHVTPTSASICTWASALCVYASNLLLPFPYRDTCCCM